MALTDNLGGINWVASASAPANTSLLWVDSNNHQLMFHNGTSWVRGVTAEGIDAVVDVGTITAAFLNSRPTYPYMGAYYAGTAPASGMPTGDYVVQYMPRPAGSEAAGVQKMISVTTGKEYVRYAVINGSVVSWSAWFARFGANQKPKAWEIDGYDQSTAVPTATTMLRWNGYLRATRVYGMFFSDNADLAEAYHVLGDTRPGTVIVIEEDGRLIPCYSDMSTKVLGVVSDSYAVLLGAKGSNMDDTPIAMTGRVPVRVAGKVAAGQYLVTSSVKGCARAVEEYIPGAVIGQALESVDQTYYEVANVMSIVRRC